MYAPTKCMMLRGSINHNATARDDAEHQAKEKTSCAQIETSVAQFPCTRAAQPRTIRLLVVEHFRERPRCIHLIEVRARARQHRISWSTRPGLHGEITLQV